MNKKIQVYPWNWDFFKKVHTITFGVYSFILTIIGSLGCVINFETLIAFLIIDVVIYIVCLVHVNRVSKVELKYDESSIVIKQGDIFSSSFKTKKVMRVFAFNEYFDTKVDNEIISENTLNGQFIKKEIKDVTDLDSKIESDRHLLANKTEENINRESGKKQKYKLGTIFKYDENTLLTALSHFDEENKAILSVQDYIRFLINFWDEINQVYGGKTIVIPLLGSGITRIDNNVYSSNQILEMILWTFYLRRIKFKKPAKLVIILDKETNQKINYYMIRRMFNGLQK